MARVKSKGKETRAITEQEYKDIIVTMREGRAGFFKPNHKAAMALILEANLGLRVSDVVKLCLNDIVRDGDRWRLAIVEQKTGKERSFVVPSQIRQFIVEYCYEYQIPGDKPIIGITTRSVQDALKKVTDFLELERIGTHSFRKYFAMRVYENSGMDIEMTRHVLQHASLQVTQRYLRVTPQRVAETLEESTILI